MRLKIFTGKTVALAMAQVRGTLGDNAVIVHVERGSRSGFARVTAAIDDSPSIDSATEVAVPPPVDTSVSYDPVHLAAVLHYHGIPASFAQRIRLAADAYEDESMAGALGEALAGLLHFTPLALQQDAILMLVGQPGQGKTLTAVRLAALTKGQGRPVRIVTTDGASAGAFAQLAAFCNPLAIPVIDAVTIDALEQTTGDSFEGLTIIDTVGMNPYALQDIEQLTRARARTKAEAILVFAANTDAQEAAETGEIFTSLGVRRMIVTRVDSSRRLAAVVATMARCKLALAAISASPFVADSLLPATPLVLAERLLDKPDPDHINRLKSKVSA